MDRMRNGWWRGGSVSTLTEYGMTLPAIQVGPTKPPEIFLPLLTRNPVGMRAGFAQFAAFSQDAKDNKVFEQTKLTMPVMAVGGEKSFGALRNHAACSDERAGGGRGALRTLADGRRTSSNSRVDS